MVSHDVAAYREIDVSIPAGAVHLVFSGSLPSSEAFAWGIWLDSRHTGPTLDGTIVTDLPLVCDLASRKLASRLASILSGFPAATIYSKVNGYYYGENGTHATLSAEKSMSLAGTAGSGTELPDQLAMVASLRTSRPGRSYRGRAYLPMCNTAQLAGGGQVGDTFVTAYATAVRGLLADLSAGESSSSTPGMIPVVVSRTLTHMEPITAVRMDSRPDTQRSRAAGETIIHTSTIAL